MKFYSNFPLRKLFAIRSMLQFYTLSKSLEINVNNLTSKLEEKKNCKSNSSFGLCWMLQNLAIRMLKLNHVDNSFDCSQMFACQQSIFMEHWNSSQSFHFIHLQLCIGQKQWLIKWLFKMLSQHQHSMNENDIVIATTSKCLMLKRLLVKLKSLPLISSICMWIIWSVFLDIWIWWIWWM